MSLTTRDGIEFETYEAGPDDASGAVLILHDWWGLLDYNRAWADRLGELGYKALLIDLYDGERAATVEEAGELMRSVDQDDADTKLQAALNYLKKGGRRVATLGWSFGGHQAMQAALMDPDAVVAAVLFYCRMVSDEAILADLGGPVLAIYAEAELAWPAKMEKFSAAMAAAGKEVVTRTYDAGHGFVNPGSTRYDQTAAEDAWQAAKAFLGRTLRER